MYEIIEESGLVYGYIFRPKPISDLGANFISHPQNNLQVSIGRYNPEHNIPPHRHRELARNLNSTEEVLIVIKGKGVLTIFDDERKKIGQAAFIAGDVIHLIRGGHQIEFETEVDIIEVKQGPFISTEKDKEIWTP